LTGASREAPFSVEDAIRVGFALSVAAAPPAAARTNIMIPGAITRTWRPDDRFGRRDRGGKR
jgi:hypothetical protein